MKKTIPENRKSYESKETAERYSEFAEKGLFEYEIAVVKRFFAPGMTVLDIGCGTGRTTGPLCEMGIDAIGIDFSSAMIAKARQTHPSVNFMRCDAKDLSPFPNESADGILFSLNGLALLTPNEKETALKEFFRVLKPGGAFVFCIPPLNIKEGYFKSKAESLGLDISNYYDRIRIGDETYDDNGSAVSISIPFECDMMTMLESCGFEIALKESSLSIIKENPENLNETIIWVATKVSDFMFSDMP